MGFFSVYNAIKCIKIMSKPKVAFLMALSMCIKRSIFLKRDSLIV